jgi:hypothetical protein
LLELRAKDIKAVTDESHLLVSAVEPLMNVLGYLEEVVRLKEPVVQRVADYRSADDAHFVLHQHELDGLPGIILDSLDDNGPVWLRVEHLKKIEPPAIDPDLGVWIEVFADPDRPPSIRDSVMVTVDGAEKDRLVEAKQARAADLEPAIKPDRRHYNIFNVRLRLADYPGLAARLDAYVAGPWTWWARAEKLRRRTMAIHARLSDIVPSGDRTDRSEEIVWGIGVSRWRRDGKEILLPVLERSVTIEVGENNEIRIRPRMVGAIADLRGFQTGRATGATPAVESSHRILEAIERDGEVSPFVPDSFEPILRVVSSQLDPEGVYLASDHDRHEPGEASPDAPEHLTVSNRWVIFARPRTKSFVLRDIERFKDAIERLATDEAELPMLARVLAFGASDDARTGARQALPGVIGRPIDIEPVAEHASVEIGDLFFPLPSNADQIDVVRRLQTSDGLVVRAAPGPAKTNAIVNVVCHHLALGLRVLVVCRGGATLAALRDKFPAVIRDLTVGLTGGDREELAQVEAAVRRLQLIVETLKPRDHVDLINRSERDVIATRLAVRDVAEEAANIARDTPGFAELPFDLVRKLILESDAHAWFEDRPPMLLTETGISLAAVDAARDARIRLGAELCHIDDDLPSVAQLPEPATVARMHQDLALSVEPEQSSTEPRERSLARRAVAALDVPGAARFADDLEALAAAHLAVADEPWLGPPCPLRKHDGAPRADSAALVDFARDATSQLSRRAAFLSRPVDTPAEAFADQDLFDVVVRLSAGEKVFTAFASREKRQRPVLDAIKIAGLAPAGPDDWQHVRDYLAWRRDVHALNARWRSLAAELGAPSLAAEYPQIIHGFERIAKSINVTIVTAAIAERNVTSVAGSKLMMPRGDVEVLLADAHKLQKLGAAVRTTAAELEASRLELTRLKELFAGEGELPAAVRDGILARIGHDGTDADEVSESWTRLRKQIALLHDKREDFNRVDAICRAFADAGAPIFAHSVKTEAAQPAAGDHVLAADWAGAWNWAALTRQMKEVGQDQQLRQLAGRREQLETTLRDQFEAVVAARTDFAAAQNLSGTVRRALTIFMIALRKMASAADGQAAHQHRRMAREALDGCSEGIPCWIMPSWRVAERLPARLGAFDLVIIDEASGSDVCELATLLRGRKILVIGDDKQVGPPSLEIDNAQTESLGDVFLRALPRTIRPFMLPGSSLYDLAKVMFPGNHIHLREDAQGYGEPIGMTSGSADVPPVTPAGSAEDAQSDQAINLFPALDEPWGGPRQTFAHSGADALADEISKVVARLPRSNRSQRQGAVSASANQKPTPLDETLIESPPIAAAAASLHQIASDDWPVSEQSPDATVAPPVRGDKQTRGIGAEGYLRETRSAETASPRWLVRTQSVHDDALQRHVSSASVNGEAPPDGTMQATGPEQNVVAQPRRAGARWLVNGRSVAIAAVFLLMMVLAAAYWLAGPDINSRLVASIPRGFALPAFAKSPDRVGQGGQQGPVAGPPQDAGAPQPKNVTTVRIDPPEASEGPSLAPTEQQRAVLYEEDPTDPKGKRYAGGVTWRTENISAAPGTPPEVVVKADLNVADAKTAVSMTFRRNTDRTLPASHVVEIKFDRPRDTPNGEISKLHGLLVKQEGKIHGIPLEGEAAKVTTGYFMVALASGAPQLQRNLKLLKENSWFEVVIDYSNGNKAILAMDKGASGEQAFKEAFAAWGQ